MYVRTFRVCVVVGIGPRKRVLHPSVGLGSVQCAVRGPIPSYTWPGAIWRNPRAAYSTVYCMQWAIRALYRLEDPSRARAVRMLLYVLRSESLSTGVTGGCAVATPVLPQDGL